MKRTDKELITKKDLFYWIVFLLIAILFILTIKLSPKTQVVEYFSFGGTLASILLATVAMIYSFYQNFSMQSSSERLNDSVNKIEKSLGSLDEFDAGLNKITSEIGLAGNELSASTILLKDNLLVTIDELRNKLSNIENYNITSNDLIQSIYTQFNTENKEVELKDSNENLGILICNASDIHLGLIKALYELYKAGNSFSTDDVTKIYLNKEELETLEGLAYLSLILSFITLLDSTSLINVNDLKSTSEITISSFNEELETYVLSN